MPVGEDQRQHLELTRDLAQRFNHRYKKTFRLPEPYILKATAKIADLQEPTAKMSKSASSAAGIIDLLDQPSVSAKKIRSAVTDSDSEIRFDRDEKPGVSNLLTIYSALTGEGVGDLVEQYAGRGYGDLKKDLAEVVVDVVTPFRDKTLALLEDQAHLSEVLRRGAEQAGEVAEATLRDVYQRVGFVAHRRAPRDRQGRGRGHHRSRRRHPRALGQRAAGLPHTASVTRPPRRSRPTSRWCRPPRSTPRRCPTSSSTWRRPPRSVDPFVVRLRGTGTFRPVSPVVFVAVAEGISGCEQLAAAVRRGPLDVELCLPLPPARDRGPRARRPRARPRSSRTWLDFECRFDVDAFHLYVHDHQHGWQPTREFPLVARNDPRSSEMASIKRAGRRRA